MKKISLTIVVLVTLFCGYRCHAGLGIEPKTNPTEEIIQIIEPTPRLDGAGAPNEE